jgi:hypothetical protein
MLSLRSLVCRAAVVAVALAALVPQARAGFVAAVTAEVSTTSTGAYHYQYTLTNDASSTLAAFDVLLNVSPFANLQVVTPPDGWFSAYAPGDTSIYFLSVDPATDLAPGNATTFSFVSDLAPLAQEYSTSGVNSTTFEFDTLTGTVLSPGLGVAAVPAPSTGVLALVGVAAGVGAAVVRRRPDALRPA